jgi:hypothetical protein
MNISSKVAFFAYFGSLIGNIRTIENLGGYSKIGC